jgi:hypothetical protein
LTAGTQSNGRYFYGSTGGLPIYSYNATNYFVDVVFTPNANPAAGVSIFASSSVPGHPAWPDGDPVQLGVRFTTSQAGSVTGIRFYKGAGDAGTHTASLWSATGDLLATADFTSETASGWQNVYFATPVAIQPGVEYRASYHTTWSAYATDSGALANPTTNGPLSTLANGGAYSYSTGFPDQAVSHNYWVDIHFVASP